MVSSDRDTAVGMLNRATMRIAHVGTVVFPKMKSMLFVIRGVDEDV